MDELINFFKRIGRDMDVFASDVKKAAAQQEEGKEFKDISLRSLMPTTTLSSNKKEASIESERTMEGFVSKQVKQIFRG